MTKLNVKEIIENEGLKFNKNNKTNCPFHSDNTPSLSYDPVKNTWKCFSCGRGNDAIEFIKAYKEINYIQACKYLNIPLNEEYKAIEDEKDKVKGYIEWEIKKNIKDMGSWKLIKLYRFVDGNNKTLYFKAKFSTQNKKQLRYYSIADSKVIAKRNAEEIPYNYYNILNTKSPIVIVEGEKDADTLIYLGYTATSLKGVKSLDNELFKDKDVYFIGDTGAAGEEYKKHIWYELKDVVSSFNVVDLPRIEKLGDNADVTDWMKAGHSKEELKAAIKDAWDWKKSTLWKYVKPVKKDGKTIYTPLKVYENLELLLNRNNIKIKYNEINRNVEIEGVEYSENDFITHIYNLCIHNDFNLSMDNVGNYLRLIALKNSKNEFKEMLETNRNDNLDILEEVFTCLKINDLENVDLYFEFFKKWCINVVRTAYNTLDNQYKSEAILVIQGSQGIGKSRFFSRLLPNSKWFKGESNLDPKNKDNIKQNTGYIITELGELDSTLKQDQARLKAFITSPYDEYRLPYARLEEKIPRITTFCGTVNKKDFLKDETGNRRYWIIPVEEIYVSELEKIDMQQFWGCIYDMWILGEKHYLSDEYKERLENHNTQFTAESDISINLDESLNWNAPEDEWIVWSLKDLSKALEIKETKALKNTLERMGYKYTNHKTKYSSSGQKKGFKLPKIITQYEYNNFNNRYN